LDSDSHHRATLAAELDAAGFDVVALVAGAERAMEALVGARPDVAVLDVVALGVDAPEAARRMRTTDGSRLSIVAMADRSEAQRVAELVAAGARGYVVKDDSRELLAAVQAVASGGGFLSTAVTRAVLDEVGRLYEREKNRNDELEELVRQLQDLSMTDWLTGLKNHGYFFERLSNELDRSLRHRRPLSVIIADIDDFKVINDTRGHAAGDRVLQEVSAVMADTVRSADVVCRIGGEEFAMVLPETDSTGAHLVAERIRDQIAGLAIPGVGQTTVSLGIAAVPEHAVDRDEIMEAADRALYMAKRNGKNRTRIAGDVVSIGTTASGHRSGRNQIIELLVRVLRLRDPALADHAERTADAALALGARVALNASQLEHLRVAALLQDVGKIGIPDRILYKQGPLSDAEWQEIKEHPKKGFELVGGLIHPEASEAVLANHERWDGAGYPRGLREEEIPLLARVLLVADAFVAMTTDRPFRTAISGPAALEELRANAGSQFDPKVVDAMEAVATTIEIEAGTRNLEDEPAA
jgi:diguanylate cyclase (GGDEF)-like protein